MKSSLLYLKCELKAKKAFSNKLWINAVPGAGWCMK